MPKITLKVSKFNTKGVFTMTKFEEIGVEIQQSATSKREAQKSFAHSCNICCCRGLHLNCDRCAIAGTHKFVVENFDMTADKLPRLITSAAR